jgi:hypothetical protein
MIAIICGPRKNDDIERVRKVLEAAVTRLGLETIIEGAGGDTDNAAHAWAVERGNVSWIRCPADWDGWAAKGQRDAAGPVRNSFMLDILLGGEAGTKRAVIAFPSSGPGTNNMVMLGNSQKATKGHVRVIMA